MPHIVVVGAGQAASSLIGTLRGDGFDGDITLIGSEPHLPYQRPPLSKGYLLGEFARERLFLRPKSFWDDNDVRVMLGKKASDIDLSAQSLSVGGETVRYDRLALCSGLVPRPLPAERGGNLANVFTVRTLADVDLFEPQLKTAERLLIVGGGYIGLEAAAVARKLGVAVTLIEAAPRILGRVAARETADHFRALHLERGVDLREGVGLKTLLGNGAVECAELDDGTRIECDLAIVGIGLLPRCAIAEAAGLETDGGVAVDERGRTSDPYVWAAGDCASLMFRGQRVRIESVGNAIDMGAGVARNMMGADIPYDPKPWFWSDQYDTKLQIAGLNLGYDRVVVRDGDGLSHWYYAGRDLLAVDAIDAGRAYMVGKRLIEAGKSPAPDAIADPATDMKALLRA